MNNDPRPRCSHEVVYPMDNCIECVKQKLEDANDKLAKWAEHNDLAPHEGCTCNYCVALVRIKFLELDEVISLLP